MATLAARIFSFEIHESFWTDFLISHMHLNKNGYFSVCFHLQVFVFDVGGKTWKFYNWTMVTTLAMFGKYDPELMCHAHSKGARVVLKGTAASCQAFSQLIEIILIIFIIFTIKRRWCSTVKHCGSQTQESVDRGEGQLSQGTVHGWHQHWHRTSGGERVAGILRSDEASQWDDGGIPQGDTRFTGEFMTWSTNSWSCILYWLSF